MINSLWLTGGQLIAYACGAGLNKVHNGWRILVGLSLIPTVVQFTCFSFLPDTPRFYVIKGNYKKAAEVLQKSYINAPQELIDQKIRELSDLNEAIPGKTPVHKFFNTVKELHTVPCNFRALVIGCASVSYTHLDVYKRQHIICSFENGRNWSFVTGEEILSTHRSSDPANEIHLTPTLHPLKYFHQHKKMVVYSNNADKVDSGVVRILEMVLFDVPIVELRLYLDNLTTKLVDYNFLTP